MGRRNPHNGGRSLGKRRPREDNRSRARDEYPCGSVGRRADAASEATREVVEKHGISEATLRRARRELGVKITGGGKNYTWSLPEAFVPDDEFETPSAA